MAGLRGAAGPAPRCGSRRVGDRRWVLSPPGKAEPGREVGAGDPVASVEGGGKPRNAPGREGRGREALGVRRRAPRSRSAERVLWVRCKTAVIATLLLMIIQLLKKRSGSSFFTGTSANFSLFLKAGALGFTIENNNTLKYLHNEGNPSTVNNTSKKCKAPAVEIHQQVLGSRWQVVGALPFAWRSSRKRTRASWALFAIGECVFWCCVRLRSPRNGDWRCSCGMEGAEGSVLCEAYGCSGNMV